LEKIAADKFGSAILNEISKVENYQIINNLIREFS
jgi:hypothetical protein